MPKALFIVEDDVDELEFYYAYYRLKEEGFEVVVASHSKWGKYAVYDEETGELRREKREVKGKRGLTIPVDIDYEEALKGEWDVLVIPGGRSPERARQHPKAVEIVRRHAEAGKPILAICHGPLLLVSAGVLRGRKTTGYWGIRDDLVNAGAEYVDEDVVRDGNIVTVRHTRFLAEGLREFMKLLRERGLTSC